jgi:hypothetical protein
MTTELHIHNKIKIVWSFGDKNMLLASIAMRFIGIKKLEKIIRTAVDEAMGTDMMRQMYLREAELLRLEGKLN